MIARSRIGSLPFLVVVAVRAVVVERDMVATHLSQVGSPCSTFCR